MQAVKDRANEHKHTLMVGRSHGIHGEPITFGLVLAIWYDEIAKSAKSSSKTQRYDQLRQALRCYGKFSPRSDGI